MIAIKTGEDVDQNNNSKNFPVVAIGASAGGLEAMIEIMQNIPNNTGMAFVYIQHLDRRHESSLVDILARVTKIPVLEVGEGTVLTTNHLFIIPPNVNMTLAGERFKLTTRSEAPLEHSPIDAFFASLAEKKRKSLIGILLSGANSDGAAGLRAIKEAGGITYVQDESAQFQTMPRSAITEGFVDAVLSPHQIAQELANVSKNTSLLVKSHQSEFSEDEMDDEYLTEDDTVKAEDLKKILHLIKRTTGVDFTDYKQNTIRRRVIRRVVLNKFENLSEYYEHLTVNVEEANLLYQDLLINVTHFFRDPETIQYLKSELLPELLKNRSVHNPLRVWVPACSTGEEAYSIAILVFEILAEKPSSKRVQIFATDLSETAIVKARVGIYTKTDVATLSPQRLERFFTRVDGHYRINKIIRDTCIFAPHNLLKDPPFSRVDLISCCNLLIYLDTVLQQRVLSNFHYALNKKGYLVLGKSETVGSSVNLFTPIDRKIRIFLKKADVAGQAILSIGFPQTKIEEVIKPKISTAVPAAKFGGQTDKLDKIVDDILLSQYVPAGVVVNYDLDILQFRGSTGLFLEPFPGKASLNLLKMVRPGLELELRNAAFKVIKSGEPVKIEGLNITYKELIHHVSFEITPLLNRTKERLLLIVFEEVKTPSLVDLKASFSKDRRVKQLEGELFALREDMRSLIEDQEAANEELQSANEEIVSSNEELQSINEELETSKEELEASNEELVVINRELQVRNDQLGEAHDYATKVIETIREAVIILDAYLLVRSANKAFYRMFNVKQEETEGKLIYEIGKGQWNVPGLKVLLEEILPNLNQYYGYEVTHTFKGVGEKVLLLSATKIVQKANHQEITLLAIEDITEHRQAAKLVEEREAWLENMADNVPVMLWVAGVDQSITFVNKTWLAFTGRTLSAETGIGWTEGVHKDDLQAVLRTYRTSFEEKKPFSIECRMKRYDGEYRWILKSAVPTYDTKGEFTGYTGSCTEIHSKKVLNEELEERIRQKTHDLQEANINLERSNSDLAQFAYVASHDLQEPLRKITTFSIRLKERFSELVPPEGREYIEKIGYSAQRMRTLIDDLLNFSRISSYKDKFIQIDLNKVLKDALNDFELLIQEKKATIFIQDKLPVVEAVPLQMNQLFTNLISNALKFSSRTSIPAISVQCSRLKEADLISFRHLDKNMEYYRIEISDNGIGFSQEYAEQIFIIFQRLNEHHEYHGTGIGLALCRKVVRNHGGEIFAKSEEGKGSTFYIILPARRVVGDDNRK